MQISNNYNAQNFKALNYSKVYGDGLKLVKKELPQLTKLGEKYDINLSSYFDALSDSDYIRIYVHHLNKKPNILKRLFSYKGYENCKVDSESITNCVKKAISTLK